MIGRAQECCQWTGRRWKYAMLKNFGVEAGMERYVKGIGGKSKGG
jgi:hypothetical protein